MTIEPIHDPARRAGPTDSSFQHLRRLAKPEFACPVCRAKQVPQSECRRCSADLTLYLKALRSVKESLIQIELASINGNSELAERALSYLNWLSPTDNR